MTDCELLQRYAETRCDAAFTELVGRYINFVYSAAIRQVGGDAHLAQDVTQSVFIDLARKARSLSSRDVLSGWLYTSTRYAAAKAVRAEHRRRAREAQTTMQPQEPSQESDWEQLQPVLDDAMHELSERDRDAVLLRYFEGRQLADVGAKLGLSEDAARMRVGRALDKLRQSLAKRGLTSTSAALATLLASQTVGAAPAGLAASVAGTALTAASATGTTITLLNIMAATKLKIALATAAVIALATPLAVQHQTQNKLRDENRSLRQHNEELSAIAAENARLSNLLAQANSGSSPQESPSIELLKLRAEVARLREDSRELARLKAENDNSGIDPSIDATLQTLAARATRLKRHLEQVPDKRIPELQFITDKEWIDAVAKTPLETDDDYHQALSSLRGSAKGKFGSMMQKALKRYAMANGDQLPTDISQLQPYLDRSVDTSVLQRYQIVRSGKLADVEGHNLIHEIAPPVDEENDMRYKFGVNGTSTERVSRTDNALFKAAQAYAKANNGLIPRDPSHLNSYLTQSIDPARIQKYLEKFPPNLRTMDEYHRYWSP